MRTKTKSKAVRDARYALTFGREADAVRLGPCVAMRNCNGPGHILRCRVRQAVIDDELQLVWDPAHVKSVGAGGTKHDLVSLCADHHAQQHLIGIESFGELYGLDLRALADEQARAHEPPLGIRGLAAKFAKRHAAQIPHLVGYDLAALMAWTRRRMERESLLVASLAPGLTVGTPCMVATVSDDLGLDEASTRTLCEQAGWPS